MSDTQNKISSACLFVTTGVLSVMICKYLCKWRHQSASLHTASVNSAYEQTLKKLFFIDLEIAKIPRHSGDESVADKFLLRRKFFSEAYKKSFEGLTPKVIHVAGTKGKGSTVEFIASAIRSSGHKVGVFTSPHIHTARERIKIGVDLISKESFTNYGLEAIELLKNQRWVVFFDLLMFIAIKYFAEKRVDYIILETGIGGRYDSTNFVDDPVAVALTSISYDHQALLGNTLDLIAWQKAGIIKKGSNVFTSSSQSEMVLDVFRKECLIQNAILHVIPPDVNMLKSVYVNMAYSVQVQNACIALSILNHLNIKPDGMQNFFWPCRMETFSIHDTLLILDGCHNGDSVLQFLESLRKNLPEYEVLVILGIGYEKCVGDIIDEVLRQSDIVVVSQSKHFRALTESALFDAMTAKSCHGEKIIGNIRKYEDFPPLLDKIGSGSIELRLDWALNYAKVKSKHNKKVVVAVCGSLFIAGEAREYLYRLQPSLFSESDWVREADFQP